MLGLSVELPLTRPLVVQRITDASLLRHGQGQ
jgi:hypothetical protein